MKNEAQASINTSKQSVLLIKGNEERNHEKTLVNMKFYMYPVAKAKVLKTLTIPLHIIVLSFNVNS